MDLFILRKAQFNLLKPISFVYNYLSSEFDNDFAFFPVWKIQKFASQNPGQKGAQKCPTSGSLGSGLGGGLRPRLGAFKAASSSCFWMKSANIKSVSARSKDLELKNSTLEIVQKILSIFLWESEMSSNPNLQNPNSQSGKTHRITTHKMHELAISQATEWTKLPNNLAGKDGRLMWGNIPCRDRMVEHAGWIRQG